eukprot:Gb_33560 [translate_table: standard]
MIDLVFSSSSSLLRFYFSSAWCPQSGGNILYSIILSVSSPYRTALRPQPMSCSFNLLQGVSSRANGTSRCPILAHLHSYFSQASSSSHPLLRTCGYQIPTVCLKCPRALSKLAHLAQVYSAFVVLYPIGAILGEMWLMYQALPYIKKKNIYGYLFNQLPFSYYSFVAALLACYPFLWMKLYLYMLKQRQSKLGKRGKGKKGVAPKLRIE